MSQAPVAYAEELSGLGILQQIADAGIATPTHLNLSAIFQREDAPELNSEEAYEQWVAIGRFLGRIHRSCKWYIGAWLNWGSGAFGNRMEQAADVTGLSVDYLKNIMWVERSVPPSRRRENLSFSTHAEVAPLTPKQQDKWLGRAEQKQRETGEPMSTRELRAEIRAAGEAKDPPPQPALGDHSDGGDEHPLSPERIKSAAILVWQRGRRAGDVYEVPVEAFSQLAAALGKGD